MGPHLLFCVDSGAPILKTPNPTCKLKSLGTPVQAKKLNCKPEASKCNEKQLHPNGRLELRVKLQHDAPHGSSELVVDILIFQPCAKLGAL